MSAPVYAPEVLTPPSPFATVDGSWVRDHPRAYRLWLGHMPSVSLVHPETARPLFSSFENVNKVSGG